nr:uncharacterized mitochondrial protein AtMg00810-like [Tanacetum cinerariifolium]
MKPDLSYLHVFDALCYPVNDSEDLELGPQFLTPRTLNSGLVPNPPSPTPYVSSPKKDQDTLFQPMFDEYFNPSPSVASPVLTVAAPEHADSTDTPSLTLIDQDAPTSIKQIFRYLRGTINMGMWYSTDSCIALTAFANADHAGCQDTKKSTSGSMQLLDFTIKDDSVLGRLKFVSKNEDNQVYGKTILDNMVSKEIKESTTYKTYFSYATGLAIPKKAGKGSKAASQQKKASLVTASDDSDPEPAKRPTRRTKPIGVVIKDTYVMSKQKTMVQAQKHKGAGLRPEVPDVSEVMSSYQESKNEALGDSKDDDDDDDQ